MPRLPRLCPGGMPLHLMQRGHNRQICFASTHDYATYARYLIIAARRFGVQVHAWVFMTNHVHMLLTPLQDGAVSRLMQTLNRNYVCYYNSTYARSGTLWEGRFRSCLVESAEYLLHCHRYIELNPVRAGMVENPADYAWSSYRSNALGIRSELVTPHALYMQLGMNKESRLHAYRELFRENIAPGVLRDIRESTNRNLALGSDRFKEKIESALSRRVRLAAPGRKWGTSVSESN